MSNTKYPNASGILGKQLSTGPGSRFPSSPVSPGQQIFDEWLRNTKFNPSSPSAHRDPGFQDLLRKTKLNPSDPSVHRRAQNAAEREAKKAIEQLGRKLAKEGVTLAERRFIMRLALRGILRFVPYLNLIILAWDIYDLYKLIKDSPPNYGGHGEVCRQPDAYGPWAGGTITGCPLSNSAYHSSTLGWGTTNFNFQDGKGLRPALAATWLWHTTAGGTPTIFNPSGFTSGLKARSRYVPRLGSETTPAVPIAPDPPKPSPPIVYPDPSRPPVPVPRPKPDVPSPPPRPTNPDEPTVSPQPEPVSPAVTPGARPTVTVPGLSPWPPPVYEPGFPPLPEPRPRPITVPRPPTVPWWPPLPGDVPTTGPGPQPEPEPKPPTTLPSTGTTPTGGPPPDRGRYDDRHIKQPPRPKEKERKAKYGSKGFQTVGWLLNAVTESADIVDSFYKALPKNILGRDWHKNGGRTPSYKNKLKTLYRHWHEVDIVKAIQNLAENQLEDWFIGKVNQAATKGLIKGGTNDLLPGSKLGAKVPQVDWSSLGL